MKFGVSGLLWVATWSDQNIPLLDKCRRYGFDSVEIPLFDMNFDPGKLKTALLDQGLSAVGCVALGPETDIASENQAVRSAGVTFVKRCIDKVHAFGGYGLGGPITTAWCKNPKRSASQEEWRWAASALNEIGTHAAEGGVTICIEPLNRFETYFINTIEQAAELIDCADADNLKILADTFHMNIEEKDTYGALLAQKDKIGYIHCAENDRGMLGAGHIDWISLFQTLRQMDFDGTVAIETFVVDMPALAGTTNTWRRLAASADALAEDGVRFLRNVAAQVLSIKAEAVGPAFSIRGGKK